MKSGRLEPWSLGIWSVVILASTAFAVDSPGPTPTPAPSSPTRHAAAPAAESDHPNPDLAAIQRVLDEYGPDVVIEWIRAKRHGKITLEVGGHLKPSLGPPNRKFVTPASVLHDLELSRIDVATFESEISGAAPVEKETMVISQADLDARGETVSQSSHGGSGQSATSQGNLSGTELDGRCRQSARSLLTNYLPGKGCQSLSFNDIRSEEEPKMNTATIYTVTGTCVMASDGIVRSFEAGARCRVKPMGGAIWAEGSTTPETTSISTGLNWFKFVD